MAAIYLIRHGQASFDKADYDHLSDTGFRQAEILGEYWRKLRHPQPDKIYRGDMLRHQQTMDAFLTGYAEIPSVSSEPRLQNETCETKGSTLQLSTTSSGEVPALKKGERGRLKAQITVNPGFNEFDHVEVLKGHIRDWSGLSTLTEFEHAFVTAFQRWQSGKYDADYAESWPQFKQRCVSALQQLIKQADGAKTLLVFTSGGTISVILQHVLALSDQNAMRFNQQIRNASVTKLLFSGSRLSVDYTNNFSHLEQAGAEWVTYR